LFPTRENCSKITILEEFKRGPGESRVRFRKYFFTAGTRNEQEEEYSQERKCPNLHDFHYTQIL
jgi:hypothetical protein